MVLLTYGNEIFKASLKTCNVPTGSWKSWPITTQNGKGTYLPLYRENREARIAEGAHHPPYYIDPPSIVCNSHIGLIRILDETNYPWSQRKDGIIPVHNKAEGLIWTDPFFILNFSYKTILIPSGNILQITEVVEFKLVIYCFPTE